jgi:hypothetical protein
MPVALNRRKTECWEDVQVPGEMFNREPGYADT